MTTTTMTMIARTIRPGGRVALRLSEEDAAAILAIARGLAGRGRVFVSVSDVLRHALRTGVDGRAGGVAR